MMAPALKNQLHQECDIWRPKMVRDNSQIINLQSTKLKQVTVYHKKYNIIIIVS